MVFRKREQPSDNRTLGRTVAIRSHIGEKGCETGSRKKQVGGRRNKKVGKGWGTRRREGRWVKRPSSKESWREKEVMVWEGATGCYWRPTAAGDGPLSGALGSSKDADS